MFDNLKVPYSAFELDHRDDMSAVQTVLGQMTGASSVPRVFVGGKFIGGCDGNFRNLRDRINFFVDTYALHNKGELKKLLAEHGLNPQ